MTKELFIREIHEDYRVKDSTTFADSHVSYLKKMTKAPVQLEDDGEPVLRRIKVKSISDVEMINDEGQWLFSCTAKIKVFD